MSEWQPIETAPKDGSRILGADGVTVEVMFWSTNSWADYGGWVNCIERSDTYVYSPDHWMPLPEPPKEPKK